MVEENFGKGSMATSVTRDSPWPPKSEFTISFPDQSGNSTIETVLRPDARISVTITAKDGEQHFLCSPRISRPQPASIRFAWRWNEAEASLAVAGKIVASTAVGFEKADEDLEILPSPWVADEATKIKLLDQSEETRLCRTSEEMGVSASGGKRLRTLKENIISLKARRLALLEMMMAAKEGRHHHLMGISGALRLLICSKHGKSFHPLLQRVAGLLDEPLLVFGNPPNIHELSIANGFAPDMADYSCVAITQEGRQYQMDLDDWLTNPGFVFVGKSFTNNQLLRLIADSDGSHHDPCVKPEFDYWNAILYSNSPIRAQMLLRTGAVVAVLAEQLLAAYGVPA